MVLIHCETGAGVLNPLAGRRGCLRSGWQGLIIDAMSSFAALKSTRAKTRFDALIAASGKCLEGVPGMGFVFIRKHSRRLRRQQPSLAMDLHDQYVYMEKTGQWRFTPPDARGGGAGRSDRASSRRRRSTGAAGALHRNYETLVTAWAPGFKPFLDPAVQAPIIVTFHAPGAPEL